MNTNVIFTFINIGIYEKLMPRSCAASFSTVLSFIKLVRSTYNTTEHECNHFRNTT